MVTVSTADGAMGAFLARPDGEGPFATIIVVHEAFGLNAHIKGIVERIAKVGCIAVAPDLYYRVPNAVVGYDKLPEALRLMSSLYDDKIIADMGALIAHLQALPEVRADRIGIIGFCMGGRVAFLTACCNPAVRAAVPFYGGGIARVMEANEHTPKAPLEYAETLQAPLLLLFGEDDPFIPLTEVEKIGARLTELGKTGECVVYPGAQHGFFCDERDSYHAEAAADAWERLGKFVEAHLLT